MTTYAAFLRGVDVGGINLPMAGVAGALVDAGFTHVRTVLATGNVLLESSTDSAVVRTKAEAASRAVRPRRATHDPGHAAGVNPRALPAARPAASACPVTVSTRGRWR
jgi:hypothetical protein